MICFFLARSPSLVFVAGLDDMFLSCSTLPGPCLAQPRLVACFNVLFPSTLFEAGNFLWLVFRGRRGVGAEV